MTSAPTPAASPETEALQDALREALRSKVVRAAFALHAALAAILCAVPLFDALGFERAFATGLLTVITSPMIAVSLIRRARRHGSTDVARSGARALLLSMLLLLPTLIAGLLYEAVTQPCNVESGAQLLLLLAGGNAAFGTALGIVAGTLSDRRSAAAIVVIGVLAFVLGRALYGLYAEPQIFVYSMPFGYWPGSLYDEQLEVDVTLWAFRGYTVLTCLAIVGAVRAFLHEPRLLLIVRTPRLPAAVGTLLIAFCAWRVGAAGEALGFSLDRASIARELSEVLVSEHFQIHIDPSATKEQAERIQQDHELRHAQLTRYFKTAPEGRIVSFVYRDTTQKAKLMGAGRTQIARPWAKEIHIHGFDFPHRVLRHELAHIFAGELATGPFKVPTSALVFVNIGVVEGIATAADWPLDELTVHEWTKAMRALNLAPDLRRALDVSGFWGISSARAYTAAGSFVRYLVTRYGMERFARLYATDDFTVAYGRSLDALVSEWELFIDTLPLPARDLVIAEHRFKQPSIFQKVCAHEAANLEELGYGRLAAGDVNGGVELLERLSELRPSDPRPQIAIANVLAADGQLDRAEAFVKSALSVDGASQRSVGEAREAMGALAWRRGDLEAAKSSFRDVFALHLSTASDRLQLARLAGIEAAPEVRDALRSHLLGDLPVTRALAELGALAHARADDGLVRYLYARMLEAAGAHALGAAEARAAVERGLPGEPLDLEARMTLGRNLLLAGRLDEAEGVFSALAQTARSEAMRLEAADWAERSSFVKKGISGPFP